MESVWEEKRQGAIVTNNVVSGLVDHKGNIDAVGILLEDNAGAGSVSIHSNSFETVAK